MSAQPTVVLSRGNVCDSGNDRRCSVPALAQTAERPSLLFGVQYTETDEPLTDRQRSILIFIDAFVRGGCAPTLREIGQHFGIRSTNGVNDHLRALVRKGCLRRNRMKSRAMWLTNKGRLEIGSDQAIVSMPCPRCGK